MQKEKEKVGVRNVRVFFSQWGQNETADSDF